jgi:serine/threonine protein phosphatase PrpC
MHMLAGAIVADYDADDFPVDSADVALHPGELLVLCSDGAIGALERAAREGHKKGDGAIDGLALVQRAMALADGSDNATVIVVDLAGDGPAPERRGARKKSAGPG